MHESADQGNTNVSCWPTIYFYTNYSNSCIPVIYFIIYDEINIIDKLKINCFLHGSFE